MISALVASSDTMVTSPTTSPGAASAPGGGAAPGKGAAPGGGDGWPGAGGRLGGSSPRRCAPHQGSAAVQGVECIRQLGGLGILHKKDKDPLDIVPLRWDVQGPDGIKEPFHR